MKSILTLLAVACVASFGFTGCATNCKQGMPKTCPMTKQACTSPTACCATSTGTCPVKKTSAKTPQ
ncbi:MAG: hypothetical protein ACOYM3_06385 [Terrimicrobiaceae bacterium]